MTISSRTPEGIPHRCTVCGKDSFVEPSYPSGDSCCESCGQLLYWFRDKFDAYASLTPEQLADAVLFLSNETVAADSLDTAELVMELEEEFGVTLPDDEAARIETIGNAIRYIQQHRKE